MVSAISDNNTVFFDDSIIRFLYDYVNQILPGYPNPQSQTQKKRAGPRVDAKVNL